MRHRILLGLLAAVLASAAGTLLGGCANVRPYEREYLSDRIMTSDEDTREEYLDQKWLEAREGSTGIAAGAGGGCACN